MAVVFDVASSGSGVAFTSTGFSFALTVGSSANRAAQMQLTMAANGATGITCSLGGISGVLVTGSDSGATITTNRTMIFSVLNPPSGSQTAIVGWTTAITSDLGVICASGVDQTTPCNNGTFSAAASSGSTSASLNVTSVSGDLPAACASVYSDGLTSLTPFTNKWGIDSSVTAGSVGAGTGTQTFTTVRPFVSDPFAISGANFVAFTGGSSVPYISAHRPAPFAPSTSTLRGF